MKVAVLGCGPSGLIAAEAARQSGADEVHIYSRKQPSVLPGAQYLHAPIPGVSDPDPKGSVRFVKMGTRAGYSAKIYDDPAMPVSWQRYEGIHQAWDLHDTYGRLWDRWEDSICDTYIAAKYVQELARRAFDLVFSTVPAPAVCRGEHRFNSSDVWITREPQPVCAEDTIIYNGVTGTPWYRTSRIFGHGSTEYRECVPGAIHGVKPTGHNCDCLPDNVIRVGRFGKWDKSVLVHHVFEEVQGALHQMLAVR